MHRQRTDWVCTHTEGYWELDTAVGSTTNGEDETRGSKVNARHKDR